MSTAWQKQANCALNEQEQGGAQLIRNENWNLEDKDFVSLDSVKVIIQGEEDLTEVAERG